MGYMLVINVALPLPRSSRFLSQLFICYITSFPTFIVKLFRFHLLLVENLYYECAILVPTYNMMYV